MYTGFQETMQKKDEIMQKKDAQVTDLVAKVVDLSDRAVQYPADKRKHPVLCVTRDGNDAFNKLLFFNKFLGFLRHHRLQRVCVLGECRNQLSHQLFALLLPLFDRGIVLAIKDLQIFGLDLLVLDGNDAFN